MFKVKRLSLYELNSIVSEIISMSLPDSYWVEAELSEAREGYGGHCYLDRVGDDVVEALWRVGEALQLHLKAEAVAHVEVAAIVEPADT